MEIYEKIKLGNNRIIHDYLVQNAHFEDRLGFSSGKNEICIPITSDSYEKVFDKLKLLFVRGHYFKRLRFALFSEQEFANSEYFALVPSMLIESFITTSRSPEGEAYYLPIRLAKIRGEYCTLCHEVLEVKGYIEIREYLMNGTDLVSAGDHELLIASDAFMSVIDKYHFSGIKFKSYFSKQGENRNFRKGLLSIDSFMPAITCLPEERRRNCTCGRTGTPDYWTY